MCATYEFSLYMCLDTCIFSSRANVRFSIHHMVRAMVDDLVLLLLCALCFLLQLNFDIGDEIIYVSRNFVYDTCNKMLQV